MSNISFHSWIIFLLFSVVFTAIVIVDSLHTIEEGNVGIYFVQGALGKKHAF